jgi:hypothetical protein
MVLAVTNFDPVAWGLAGLLLGFVPQQWCPEGRANDVCHPCDTTAVALSWLKQANLYVVWGGTHFYVEI